MTTHEFHPMRRRDRAIPDAEAMELLRAGEYGVLSTADADGVPAGVPLNYVLDGDSIAFHCARSGQKLCNMRAQPRVSFVVVGDTKPVYQGDFTTLYTSVVVHGTAERVEDEAERIRLLTALCEKYLPEYWDRIEASIAGSGKVTDVWRVRMEHITGKSRRPKPAAE